MANDKSAIPRRELEIDGEIYLAPVVTRGSVTSDEDKKTIIELICIMYGTGEYSIRTCCGYVGISTSTFHNWREANEDFDTLYSIAQAERGKKYRQAVAEASQETALKIIRGDMIRKVRRVEKFYQADSKGKPILVGQKIIEQEQWLKPSTGLLTGMMEITDPDNFSRQLMLEQRLNGATTDSLEEIINSLRIVDDEEDGYEPKPPITSEEDARAYGLTLKPPEKKD